MSAVDFLGGKYRQSEQILPGPVQTFRANESSTGRSVFVHRVSTSGDTAQQISLLRLLSLALLRSTTTRNLVLDITEEGGFWYVVTQSEPQCLLLREWLQFEIDQTAGQSNPSLKREPAPPPVKEPATQPPPAKPEASKAEPPKQETGEFTRFFKGGMPGVKPAANRERPSNPGVTRGQDRPSRISGFVQRPNTPGVPLPQRSHEPGEFTRIFSRPADEAASTGPKSQPPAALFPEMFPATSGIPAPTPAPSAEPGEYTRIFGKGNAPPAIQQPSTTVSPRARSFDESLTKAAPAGPSAPVPPIAKGPSEYTQVIQRKPPQEASVAAPAPGGAGSSVPPVPPLNLSVPKVQPPAAPSLKMPAAAMPTAPPPINVAGSNKMLIIFFSILGALAVLIVIVCAIVLKK